MMKTRILLGLAIAALGVVAHGTSADPIVKRRRLQGETTFCGGGSVGNGTCADSTLCCSQYGYCGSTSEYCAGVACGGGKVGNGVCADSTLCCSAFGYCGSTSEYCSTKAPTPAPGVSCGAGTVGNGVCADSTLCCSQYGYCGSTSEYCGNKTQTSAPAPVASGSCGGGSIGNTICADPTLCCSQYGYCGNTSEYCGNKAKTASPSPPLPPFAPVTPYPTPAPVPTATAKCKGISGVMTVNFGYYASWARGRSASCNKVAPQDINVTGNGYTHLAYSFAGINASDQIAPSGDDYTAEVPQYVAFNALKQTNPGLKTLIAVGGGSFNATLFSDIAASPQRRATFAVSIVAFLEKYGFDGVDVDWEYPGDPATGNAADYNNFPLLLKAIRVAAAAAGKKILITTAITVNVNTLSVGYNLAALSKQLDFFNVMAYDINGPWNNPPVVGSNTDSSYFKPTIQYMLKKGVPPNKMVLGLAAYGRTFILSDPNCNEPGCSFKTGGPGGCAGDTGVMPYFTIDQSYVQGNNYNSLRFNPKTSSMELVTGGAVWISFDNLFTFNLKRSYAAASCMRGVMWWSVDQLASPIALDSSQPNPKPKRSGKRSRRPKGKRLQL